MKAAWLPEGNERARMAGAAVGLGLVLIAMDFYWGNGRIHGHGHGILALAFLLVGSAGSQAFEYARYAGLLRRPRFPDVYLAAGASYRQREGIARSAADRIALRSGTATLLAGLTVLAPQAGRPVFVAAGLAGIVAEAFLIWAAFRLAVSGGWFPPSRAVFHGRAGTEKRWTRKAGSAWLAFSGSLIRKVASRLPAPYGWLFGRKALHVIREDPLAPALLSMLVLGAAAAFRASGDLFLCGFFALAACMASLCLARRLGGACDAFAADHVYLFPPRRFLFRCDWVLALILAAPFPIYYAGCAASLLGPGAALRSQSVWQMALSAFAFACLIVNDGYVRGRGEPAQAMLAGGYLGIAGVLFMFPGYGVALAGMVAAGAAAACMREARTPAAQGDPEREVPERMRRPNEKGRSP